MRYVVRMWAHPHGWEGDGWKYKTVAKFEAMMRVAARKRRGLPALVQSWDDGRRVLCWYAARAGAEENALRERCRRVFGARDRNTDANLWKAVRVS